MPLLNPAVIITAWVAYTPTLAGMVASSMSFFSRRVADSIEIHGTITLTSSSATTAAISIGYAGTSGNITVDTAKMAAGTLLGVAWVNNNGSVSTPILMPASSTTTFALAAQGGTPPLTPAAGNGIFGTGQRIDIPTIVLPIVGWA